MLLCVIYGRTEQYIPPQQFAHKNQKVCGIINVMIASPESHPPHPSKACRHYKVHIKTNPIDGYILEKLTFAQQVNKFSIFCGIKNFIANHQKAHR
jgi:hypothetical protein